MSAVIHLQALGLTEYEARAYTALLALGRAVPARIARQASIPRPKIYETLERLEGRGLAAKVGQNPLEYAPLSAREYLSRSRRSFDDRLAALGRDLSRLTPDPAPEAVYHLSNGAAIFSLCQDLALNARKHIYMAGAYSLAKQLENQVSRGVAIYYAPLDHVPAIANREQMPFLLARDDEAALIAHFNNIPQAFMLNETFAIDQITTADSQSIDAHGVHTHNPIIVHLIEGYIKMAAQNAAN